MSQCHHVRAPGSSNKDFVAEEEHTMHLMTVMPETYLRYIFVLGKVALGGEQNEQTVNRQHPDPRGSYCQTVANPWFYDWDERRTDAQDLLAFLKIPSRLHTFDDCFNTNWHMMNFHRLHRSCGVSPLNYIQHVLALGDVRLDVCGRNGYWVDRVLLPHFAILYTRWSGIAIDFDADVEPEPLIRTVTVPFDMDMDDIWDRRGVGEAAMYFGRP
ncbi:hypothetical protein PUNSTDRAFT_45025 [Punctularia strigosozonata HHB-11173 SS5]|uniref:uncharacterized protein n=1 Tax=Punctularia strigosozonata (strain HHB-11173) TaxID=741275 RepID=UPI0004416969|nr:uncharacterized protein PUNSTDRAFT_45025 [Punctularia strigosozonata HHB-11173 SS5]EIN08545.1 hypothetical protein PUNSTDRAFT_45025 [Punctularia strigosozonata HHB-11173 SS5]